MGKINLAPHEILELRELLSNSIVSMKKFHSTISIVKDEEFKSLIQRCISTKKRNITSMQNFIGSMGNEKGGEAQ